MLAHTRETKPPPLLVLPKLLGDVPKLFVRQR
jgi:hypothetical protein